MSSYANDRPKTDVQSGPRTPTRPVEHGTYREALDAPVHPSIIPQVEPPAPAPADVTAVNKTDEQVKTLARVAIRQTASAVMSPAYREQAVRCAARVGCQPPVPAGAL